MKEISLHSEHLLGYLVSNKLVVLNKRNSELHALDEFGGWLLLALDESIGEEEISKTLQSQGISETQIIKGLSAIRSLFFGHAETCEKYRQEYAEILSTPIDSTLIGQGIYVEVGGITFQLIASDWQIQNDLKHVLQGVLSSNDANIRGQFTVMRKDSGIQVMCNRSYCFSVKEYDQLMPRIMDHLQIMAYQAQPYLLALHSAMLAIKGRGLILPGLSGSGKSTLCVSLLKRGYQFLSDEVTVLSLSDATLMPFVLPPAVKTGSWPVLVDAWPEIKHATVWKRSDGRELKYLQLPGEAYPDPLEGTVVHAIVFPAYGRQYKQAKIESLDEIAALELLTGSGFQVKDSLNQEKVEKLLTWIGDASCYRLCYASLSQAHQLIDEIMQ